MMQPDEATGGISILRSLHERLKANVGLQTILANIGWLTFDKVLRMTVGLFVVAWMARYLGPEGFGLLSYVIAYVGLFGALTKLGFDGIIVRDVVRKPHLTDEILGTAFFLKLVGGLVLIGVSIAGIRIMRPGEPLVLVMTAVVGAGYLFRAFETIEFWFRSQLKSKYAVLAQSGAFLIGAAYRILLILGGAGVVYFAATPLIEAALGALGLVVGYRWFGHRISRWRPGPERAHSLLGESWPAFLSVIFAMIYHQIDQVMLGQMIGDRAVGIYGAVVRVSTIWYFIPMAVTWSVQPAIVRAREKGKTLYYTRLQDLFTAMALVAYAISIPIALSSSLIIRVLFGSEYLEAGPILAVHILSSVFLFIGIVRGLWVTNESYFKFGLMANTLAAMTNIVLNAVMIPRFGIIGAAYATFISYFVTYIGASLLYTEARPIFRMQIRSLLLIDLYRMVRERILLHNADNDGRR